MSHTIFLSNAPRLPYTHEHKTLSTSTNLELIAAIKNRQKDPNHCHLLTAQSQSQGRGQHGRQWLSPTGNVHLSLYVPLNSPYLVNLSGALSLFVGYGLYQMPIIQAINIQRKTMKRPLIQVKWANDLGFYDKPPSQGVPAFFKKLIGILIESVADDKMLGVVVGVGLNVANSPIISDGLYEATSLSDLLTDATPCPITHPLIQSGFDPTLLYHEVAQAILHACQWYKQRTLGDDFVHAFEAAHALQGKTVGIFPQNSTTPSHTGVCTGICQDGTLILNGQVSVMTGMAKWLHSDDLTIGS